MEFSVLMSVYKNDNSEYLKQALDSVITNTIPPTEIVLVIDGPVSNEIMNVISKYKKEYSFLNVIPLEENVGLGTALKIGLEQCSYEVVARMDSDDVAIKDRFEQQIQYFIKDSELSVVGGSILEFEGKIDNIISRRSVPTSNKEIYRYMKKRCPFNHMTVMFRKDHIQNVGGYKDWHYNEDYYLWIRMQLKGYNFLNLKDDLVKVRIDKNTFKRRGGKRYFTSEIRLQKYCYDKGLINSYEYIRNIFIRIIVQMLMPNGIRKLMYKKMFRNKIN